MHVAAPGEGFGAPGRGGDYVPIQGTSFAAPLVTATAALLYAEGIADPCAIKQRIISTSDPDPNFGGKIQGGLLNVKHAITTPRRAILIGLDDRETPVALALTGGSDIYIPDSGIYIPLSDILRLKNNGDGTFYLVYKDPSSPKDLRVTNSVSPDSDHPWSFNFYMLNNHNVVVGRPNHGSLSDLKDYIGPIN